MEQYNIKDFTRGWFIGNFDPSIVKREDFEIGVKIFSKGQTEKAHYHEKTDEITVVVQGRCRLNNIVLDEGDIVWIKPKEVAEFEALEDCKLAIIKIPSLPEDKYSI
ncbi:MAG TPA: hypothetical protein VF185_04290 [Patescibacteria group bacterium]